jgi:hypothetical protein
MKLSAVKIQFYFVEIYVFDAEYQINYQTTTSGQVWYYTIIVFCWGQYKFLWTLKTIFTEALVCQNVLAQTTQSYRNYDLSTEEKHSEVNPSRLFRYYTQNSIN